MKYLLPLLFCINTYGQIKEIDRPWIRGRSDTIYHTVAITAKTEFDTTYLYHYIEDKLKYKDSAITRFGWARKQIDTVRKIKNVDSLHISYSGFTIIGGTYHIRHIPKRIKKSRKKHYKKAPCPGCPIRAKGYPTTYNLYYAVYKDDRYGERYIVEPFNGTIKQWDSIGRIYLRKINKQ